MDSATRDHIETTIRSLVAAGRTTWSDLTDTAIPDICEGEGLTDVEQEWAVDFASQAWQHRVTESAHWPRPTDVDKLAAAFTALRAAGFSCGGVEGSAVTQSDLFSDLAEEYLAAKASATGEQGPAFYLGCHEQDISRCLFEPGELFLMHGVFTEEGGDGDATAAQLAVDALTAAGLTAVWNGDPQKRIHLENFSWHKDLPAGGPTSSTTQPILRAKTSTGDTYDDPSEDLLFMLFEDVQRGDAEFFIVDRLTDPAAQTFAQTVPDNNTAGGWIVERREGSADAHFSASFPDLRSAHEALTRWTFGLQPDPDTAWERLDFS